MIATIAYLVYDPIVRLHLGPLAISPHGIGTAVGFLAGARLLRSAAHRIGIDDELLYAALTRAAIGAAIGARLAYVVNHASEFDSVWEVLAVWEGGLSLLGGIAGGVAAATPLLRRRGVNWWAAMDAAAPGLALGIAIGRIGDLVVADHLGKPTDFALGYVCPDADTASRCAAPVGQAVHQPALYDMISAAALLGVLLWLRRRERYAGFLIAVFGAWYGAGRFVEDFYRIDETHGLGLSGSQITAGVVALASLAVLLSLRRTPGRTRPATTPEEQRHADA